MIKCTWRERRVVFLLAVLCFLEPAAIFARALQDDFTFSAQKATGQSRDSGGPVIDITLSYFGAHPITLMTKMALHEYCHFPDTPAGWRQQQVTNGMVMSRLTQGGSPKELTAGQAVTDHVRVCHGDFLRIASGHFKLPIGITMPVMRDGQIKELNLQTVVDLAVSDTEAIKYNNERKQNELRQLFEVSARLLPTYAPAQIPDVEYTVTYKGSQPVTVLLDPPLCDTVCLPEGYREGWELWALTSCAPRERSPAKSPQTLVSGGKIVDVVHLENYYKRIGPGEKGLPIHLNLRLRYEGTEFPLQVNDGWLKITIADEQARPVNDRAAAYDRQNR